MHFKIFTILKKKDTQIDKNVYLTGFLQFWVVFHVLQKTAWNTRLIPVSLWMRVGLSALVFIWCSRNSSSLIFVLFFSFFYSAQIYLNGTSSAYKLSPSSRILLLFRCFFLLFKFVGYVSRNSLPICSCLIKIIVFHYNAHIYIYEQLQFRFISFHSIGLTIIKWNKIKYQVIYFKLVTFTKCSCFHVIGQLVMP